MTIKLVNRGNEGELVMVGRLDSTNAEEAHEIFQQMAAKFETLILNFAQLDYISSAGLRSLKRLYVTMQKKQGQLILRGANPYVTEVMEMTGFASMFRMK